MPAYNIKGITVEIGGDTKNFNTALDELNRKVNSSATEIGKLNRLLKLDPSNTVLLMSQTDRAALLYEISPCCITKKGMNHGRTYHD